MKKATSKQLRFPTIDSLSERTAFDSGALSSEFGALLLAGVDRQAGLIQRLALSFQDGRHASFVEHHLVNLMKKRGYQQGSQYEDGNDFSRLENAAIRKDIYRMNLVDHFMSIESRLLFSDP